MNLSIQAVVGRFERSVTAGIRYGRREMDDPAKDNVTEASAHSWRFGGDDDLTFIVSRADIRRYALSVGAAAGIHHDVAAARQAGYRDIVGPAYFFQTIGTSLGRLVPAAALRPDGLIGEDDSEDRVVAGGSEVTLGAPICAGDEVQVTVSEDPPEIKQGSRARLTIRTMHRTYSVAGVVAAQEVYVRIGHG
jgi:hypothetical protein